MKEPTHSQTYQPRTLFGSLRRKMETRRRWTLLLKLVVLLVTGVGIPLLALAPIWLDWPIGALNGAALFWLVLAWLALFLSMLLPGWAIRFYTQSDARTLWDKAELTEGTIESMRTAALPSGERAVLVTYTYLDLEEQTHRDHHWLRGASYDRIVLNHGGRDFLDEGAPLQIAFDPEEPALNMVPAFAEDLFEAVRQDRRVRLTPTREATPALDLQEPLSMSLYADARQAASRGGMLRRTYPGARLELDQQGLTWIEEGNTRRLLWSRPLTVLLTTWVVSTQEADLHLKLRQQGWPTHTPSIQLSVRLPQSQLDSRILVKNEHNPHLDPQDLTRLWQMLMHCTEMQGERLGDRVRLDNIEVLRKVV